LTHSCAGQYIEGVERKELLAAEEEGANRKNRWRGVKWKNTCGEKK
jgi:hypothetical protein